MYSLFGLFSKADIGQFVRSRILWPTWRGNWILGRHACLGRDVINLTANRLPIFNIQKGRVDYFVSALEFKHTRTRTSVLGRYLSRIDIVPFLRQQEYCHNLPKHSPKFVYMDSFAELADQLFIHKKCRWGGCCYYSDVDHTEDFDETFEARGLLKIEELESSYRQFFSLVRERYGEVPIIYLHFPSALELRTQYLERGRLILETITKLASEFLNVYSLTVDERVVSRPNVVSPELQDFPYHYSNETYIDFSKKLNQLFERHNFFAGNDD